MLKNYWNKFCVVGLGKHAQLKIIPSLQASNKQILGVVTSGNIKSTQTLFKTFKTIDEALKNLSKDTVFIISTPPDIHNDQINKILKYGRDVIVEKPGFINSQDIINISQSENFNKNIIFEGFMYKYTKLYKKFIVFWMKNKKEISTLKSYFYIPEVPKNTFREDKTIKSSCLYDMGCYSLSLLTDLGLDIDNIQISNFTMKDERILNMQLLGESDQVKIELNFGVSKKYKNTLELIKKNNDTIKFWPFFNGVPIDKFLEYCSLDNIELERFKDCNAFSRMFNLERKTLLLNQVNRFNNMFIVTDKLNFLEKQFKLILNHKMKKIKK